jgi:hypothetical protein
MLAEFGSPRLAKDRKAKGGLRQMVEGWIKATAMIGAALLLAAGAGASHAQQQQPAPARINGKPNLNGIWQVLNNSAHWNLEAHVASPLEEFWRLGAIGAIPAGQSVIGGDGKIPYLPEALAQRDENRAGWPKNDPEAACYLPGIPRATYMPYPFQIVQGDGDIMFIYAFANANRAVHMKDIRTLDEVPADFWMGWSNGRWDGDTLVVEVIANDARTWLDRSGNHHSNQMTVTERYTLLDPNRIQYQATIEDPQVFSRPWTLSLILYRHTEPNFELLEFKCVEFSENLLYGEFLKEPPK